jgi:hypothetical protein
MAGFEPAASTSQMWRDTGLRYIPKGSAKVSFKITDANFFLNSFLPVFLLQLAVLNLILSIALIMFDLI